MIASSSSSLRGVLSDSTLPLPCQRVSVRLGSASRRATLSPGFCANKPRGRRSSSISPPLPWRWRRPGPSPSGLPCYTDRRFIWGSRPPGEGGPISPSYSGGGLTDQHQKNLVRQPLTSEFGRDEVAISAEIPDAPRLPALTTFSMGQAARRRFWPGRPLAVLPLPSRRIAFLPIPDGSRAGGGMGGNRVERPGQESMGRATPVNRTQERGFRGGCAAGAGLRLALPVIAVVALWLAAATAVAQQPQRSPLRRSHGQRPGCAVAERQAG